MKIEVLIFEGCPNSNATEDLVRSTVAELGIRANIEVIKVLDNADAISKRFLGSPSIRIRDRDLEIDENDQTQYSMRCRVYRVSNRYLGVPPKELVVKKLLEAN